MVDEKLRELLRRACDCGASDLHLSAGMPAVFRVDGDLQRDPSPAMANEDISAMLRSIISDEAFDNFYKNLEIDFSFTVAELSRFRANCFFQNEGISCVFRLIPKEPPSLKALNAPGIFKEIITASQGLILVTGATGSGKSTTLAALINYINETKKRHILTIEDPIEFVYQSNNCLISQREVYQHTHSFANALKSALREDPDVILVGEMRDLETIQLALSAAETGHLVLGTLHTNSATKAIDRIIDAFSGENKGLIRAMLSESLRAVISQKLIKKKVGGRIAAHEILIANSAIKNLIREDKVAQMYSVLQTGSRYGMQTFEQDISRLLKTGIVDRADAMPYLDALNIIK